MSAWSKETARQTGPHQKLSLRAILLISGTLVASGGGYTAAYLASIYLEKLAPALRSPTFELPDEISLKFGLCMGAIFGVLWISVWQGNLDALEGAHNDKQLKTRAAGKPKGAMLTALFLLPFALFTAVTFCTSLRYMVTMNLDGISRTILALIALLTLANSIAILWFLGSDYRQLPEIERAQIDPVVPAGKSNAIRPLGAGALWLVRHVCLAISYLLLLYFVPDVLAKGASQLVELLHLGDSGSPSSFDELATFALVLFLAPIWVIWVCANNYKRFLGSFVPFLQKGLRHSTRGIGLFAWRNLKWLVLLLACAGGPLEEFGLYFSYAHDNPLWRTDEVQKVLFCLLSFVTPIIAVLPLILIENCVKAGTSPPTSTSSHAPTGPKEGS